MRKTSMTLAAVLLFAVMLSGSALGYTKSTTVDAHGNKFRETVTYTQYSKLEWKVTKVVDEYLLYDLLYGAVYCNLVTGGQQVYPHANALCVNTFYPNKVVRNGSTVQAEWLVHHPGFSNFSVYVNVTLPLLGT
jgi:hypothetical protein